MHQLLRSTGRLYAAVVLAVALAAMCAACAGGGPSAIVHSGAPPPAPPTPSPAPEQLIDAYIADIEAYWTDELPARYGVVLEPLGPAVAYRSSDPATLPRCNGLHIEQSFATANAFFCAQERVIAYDADELVVQMRRDFGPLAVGVLFAHEYAHAVQRQAGEDGSTIGVELQADCFAGAWVAAARPAGSPEFAVSDVDRALRSYIEYADPPGVAADDPDAHGTTFDRVSAFTQGFVRGATACVDYDTAPPLVPAVGPGGATSSDPPTPRPSSVADLIRTDDPAAVRVGLETVCAEGAALADVFVATSVPGTARAELDHAMERVVLAAGETAPAVRRARALRDGFDGGAAACELSSAE